MKGNFAAVVLVVVGIICPQEVIHMGAAVEDINSIK